MINCISIIPDYLRVENQDDGRTDRLLHDVVGIFDFGVSLTRYVTVKEGFITDWASVPRLFWRIIPARGKYNKAAILHDWLYVTQPSWCSRKEADQIFRAAMKHLGVETWKRNAMYMAVRVGGGVPWKRNQGGKRCQQG